MHYNKLERKVRKQNATLLPRQCYLWLSRANSPDMKCGDVANKEMESGIHETRRHVMTCAHAQADTYIDKAEKSESDVLKTNQSNRPRPLTVGLLWLDSTEVHSRRTVTGINVYPDANRHSIICRHNSLITRIRKLINFCYGGQTRLQTMRSTVYTKRKAIQA
jgi:hypothetical protein